MKRMLKIFIFLMSMSFVISSCSSSSKEVFDMTFSSVSDGIADLGGMNVRYEIAYADTTYLGLDITSEFADLARERVANVEKDYNCTVELVHGTGSFGTLVASTYAGTYLCDILCGYRAVETAVSRTGSDYLQHLVLKSRRKCFCLCLKLLYPASHIFKLCLSLHSKLV